MGDDRGVKVRCHTDGNITALLPDLVDLGIDLLHPLEAKAGMQPLEVKRDYGSQLAIHGALNAMLWTDLDAIEAEIRRLYRRDAVGRIRLCLGPFDTQQRQFPEHSRDRRLCQEIRELHRLTFPAVRHLRSILDLIALTSPIFSGSLGWPQAVARDPLAARDRKELHP